MPDSFDRPPWLDGRCRPSISHMSSAEGPGASADVFIHTACFVAAGPFAYIFFVPRSDQLGVKVSRKQEYGYACGWAVVVEPNGLYQNGSLGQEKKGHSICCTSNLYLLARTPYCHHGV